MSSRSTPLTAVINHSTSMPQSELVILAAALQHVNAFELGPIWYVGAKVQAFEDPARVPSNARVLGIFDTADQAGALGYHDLTASGQPLGKVFWADDLKYGYDPYITTGHEFCEMQIDPWIDLSVQIDSRTIYAYEVSDACEADQYGHDITFNVGAALYTRKATDFVTPNWFDQVPGQYDFGRHISRPLQLLTGGYIGEAVISAGQLSWSQKSADDSAVTSRRIALRNKKLNGGLERSRPVIS